MSEQLVEQEKAPSFFVSSGLLAFFLLLAVSTYLTEPLGSSEFYAHLHRGQNDSAGLIDKFVSTVETASGERGLILLKGLFIFLFSSSLAFFCARAAKSQFLGLLLTFIVAACSFESAKIAYSALKFPQLLLYEFYGGFDLAHFADYRIAGIVILTVLFIYYLKTSAKFSKKEASLIFVASSFSIAVPDFAIWPMSYLAFAISRICGEESLEQNQISLGLVKLQKKLAKLPADGLIWLALVLSILNIRNLYLQPVADQFFPVGAMNYIVDKELEGAILSAPVVGSYIDYRLGSSSFARAAVTEDFQVQDARATALVSKLFKDTSQLDYLINYYQPRTALCINTDALCKALLNDKNWQKVYPKESGPAGVYNWQVFRVLSKSPE